MTKERWTELGLKSGKIGQGSVFSLFPSFPSSLLFLSDCFFSSSQTVYSSSQAVFLLLTLFFPLSQTVDVKSDCLDAFRACRQRENEAFFTINQCDHKTVDLIESSRWRWICFQQISLPRSLRDFLDDEEDYDESYDIDYDEDYYEGLDLDLGIDLDQEENYIDDQSS